MSYNITINTLFINEHAWLVYIIIQYWNEESHEVQNKLRVSTCLASKLNQIILQSDLLHSIPRHFFNFSWEDFLYIVNGALNRETSPFISCMSLYDDIGLFNCYIITVMTNSTLCERKSMDGWRRCKGQCITYRFVTFRQWVMAWVSSCTEETINSIYIMSTQNTRIWYYVGAIVYCMVTFYIL